MTEESFGLFANKRKKWATNISNGSLEKFN
jgi:hypothetical protein